MQKYISYRNSSIPPTADEFLDLCRRVYPTKQFDKNLIQAALNKTLCISAWEENFLIGCVRVLTDGYLFSTIPEIFVDSDYRKQGVGKKLLELAVEESPTNIFLGAKESAVEFYKKTGWEIGPQSFIKKKI